MIGIPRVAIRLIGALVLLLAVTPAVAESVDEVIDKHIAARGGRAAWDAVESLRITGTYTSFSRHEPFTLLRKRAQKIRFESVMSGHPFLMAFDGENAWHINAFYQIDWAWRLGDQDQIAFRQEYDFATPLFNYREMGHEVELLGPMEVDGIAAVAIRLTRSDGQEETWYLDPDTYLEVARDSQGSDFGSPAEQRSFYEDFRQVGEVMIPFFTETQWYTRDRILEFDEVEINADLDDEVFAFPAPPGMAKLATLAGEWEVAVEERSSPRQPWQESARSAVITPLVRGALLQEEFVTDSGTEVVRQLSYDQFRQRYRLSQIDGFSTHLDIQEGNFDDDGRLTVTNVETGTEWSGYGETFHERHAVFNILDDSFQVEQEVSRDGGETWFLAGKMTYTRK